LFTWAAKVKMVLTQPRAGSMVVAMLVAPKAAAAPAAAAAVHPMCARVATAWPIGRWWPVGVAVAHGYFPLPHKLPVALAVEQPAPMVVLVLPPQMVALVLAADLRVVAPVALLAVPLPPLGQVVDSALAVLAVLVILSKVPVYRLLVAEVAVGTTVAVAVAVARAALLVILALVAAGVVPHLQSPLQRA
jgi:hypothetical protein